MFSAERSAIEIDEETLLEVCHFFNRKDLTLISTVSQRFRDLIHTHLRQTPFLLLPLMYLPPYGEEKALVRIQGLGRYRNFTPNEPPFCCPAPSYLRFTWVDINADHIFDFCPYEFMGLLERFQSAFVDCILSITIDYVKRPFSKRSFLYFLTQQLLPVFTKCSKYVITSPYLRIYDPKERDTEQLLLVPQLYNSRGPIELVFHSYVGCTYLPDEYFGPTISVSEVITWLNHPSPIEDPSKPRVLKLGYSCLSDSCLTDVRLEKARDIKNRLIELFLNSTQRCSYRLELRHDAYNPSARLDLVRHGLDDCIATNPNTAEQLAVSFKENGMLLYHHEKHLSQKESRPFICYERSPLLL